LICNDHFIAKHYANAQCVGLKVLQIDDYGRWTARHVITARRTDWIVHASIPI